MKLRPEINDVKYYIHLLIISYIVQFLVSHIITAMPITFKSVVYGAVFIGLADVCAHTLLSLD